MLALPMSIIVSRSRGRKVQLADWITVAGFIIGILLVSQMTWAIVLEGEGEYQMNLEKHRVGRVATVGDLLRIPESEGTKLCAVASYQRSLMDHLRSPYKGVRLFIY